jgi:hypothetical protein
MDDIFKDYGSAIGPTLAFCLGVLALFIKNTVDRYLEKRKVRSELKKLSDLIRASAPPKTFHPKKHDDAPTPDVLRNKYNIITLHNRLIGITPMIEHLDKFIYKHGTLNNIRLFNNLKFRFEIMLRHVEEVREKKLGSITSLDIKTANENHQNLLETFDDPNKLFNYFEQT